MNTLRASGLWTCALCVVMLGGARAMAAGGAAAAADPGAVLKPFVSADAFCAAYVDLTRVDPVAIAGEVADLLEIPGDGQEEIRKRAAAVKGILDGTRAAGIRTIGAVVGPADISRVGGPLVVVQVDDPKNLGTAEGWLRAWHVVDPPVDDASPPFQFRRHSSGVLLAGTQRTLDRYESLTAAQRPELTGPLAKAAQVGTAAAVVFSPGPDFRRVLAELLPPLPALKQGTGKFIAERLRYAVLAVDSSPQLSLHGTVQWDSAEAAKTAADMVRKAPQALDELVAKSNAPPEARQLVALLGEVLAPAVEGDRVTVRVASDDPRLSRLAKLLAPVVDEAFEPTRRRQSMNSLKHLALAMFNYLDKNKHFPASAAIRDADGKPLLSWRVAVLPYLGGNAEALYKQFHLDEPWDSPHNRVLVTKMPAVFAAPGTAQLAQEGKTTYLVPVGPGTAFDSAEGIAIREITDGTSKTIMVVDVAPDRAVEWTRPADWNVDMEHPKDGLDTAGRNTFVAALCDGSVYAFPTHVEPDVLRAMLTRAGGEVYETPR